MPISLPRDANRITVIGGTSSADGTTPTTIYVDPTSHRVLVDSSGGTGTVTSVASADGSITVTNPTTTVDLAIVKAPILTTARNINGVSFNGSANITIPEMVWTATTVNATMVINNGYLANKGTLLTLTLPVTAAVGSVLQIAGMNAGLWSIAQNASGIIHYGNQNTTTGVTGSLSSILTYDAVKLVCSVANNEWVVASSVGNLTVT